MPTLTSLLQALVESPTPRLEHFTALALDQLVSGFRAVDQRAARLMEHVHKRMPEEHVGQMSPLVRIYLDYTSSEEGARFALALLRSVADELTDEPTASPLVHQHCVTMLLDAIEHGRSALFLSEATVLCLYHFIGGYLAALDQFDAAGAARQLGEIVAFERWLGEQHGESNVPWHRILMTYEGPGTTGIEAFARNWCSWRASQSAAAD